MTIPETQQARQIAEEGLSMCPEVPAFYRMLAGVNLNDYFLGSSKSPQKSIELAEEFLQKTLAMDDGDIYALSQFCNVYVRRREYDKAIASGEQAVRLDPNSAWALMWFGTALLFGSRPEEAIPLLEKAIRFNLLGPGIFYLHYGNALRETGRLEEAAASYKKAVDRARIIVKPEAIDDLASARLARDVAKKIEETMQYPGQIRVTVIRETRSTEIAK